LLPPPPPPTGDAGCECGDDGVVVVDDGEWRDDDEAAAGVITGTIRAGGVIDRRFSEIGRWWWSPPLAVDDGVRHSTSLALRDKKRTDLSLFTQRNC
jgi:hypothetical protein